MRNFGTLRVDYTSGKLQVASGKFQNCVAIIDNLKCCEAFSSLSALADREGDRLMSSFL